MAKADIPKQSGGTVPAAGKVEALHADPEDFLDLAPPNVPVLLDNVLLVFANSIADDALPQCKIEATGRTYPSGNDEAEQRAFLVEFVRERLDMVSRREYGLWLNGRLPFITPRELLVWRLRQYVEYVWAFQLPDDEDLALIFNTTKLRAAGVAADFIARFRKALLFPIALRRLYRILRNEDPRYRLLEEEYPHQRSFGPTFLVPSRRYLVDANSLIDEFRLRVDGPLRDAVLINDSEGVLWIQDRVFELVQDDGIRGELLRLYQIPRDAGYEG